jgi:hypothetical protein
MKVNLSDKDHDQPPSDEFMEAVVSGGSIVIECEFCGRVHFATWDDGAGWEEGELEELRANAEKEPDRYIEDATCSSISWGYLNNQQAVYGCPCNHAKKIEDWIWGHRRIIADYLKRRITSTKRDAEMEEELFEGVVESAAELLTRWLEREGWKVDGNCVHNGSYWSRIENVDITKVKVGSLTIDVHSPSSFPEVAKYLKKCDEDAKAFMRKKEAVT